MMAQWIGGLAFDSDNLSSVFGSRMIEEELAPRGSLTTTNVLWNTIR